MDSLFAIAIPALIIGLFIRAVLYRKQIEAQNWEDKTGQVLLYRIRCSRDDVYHRSSCVDVIMDGGANTVLIENPEQAISKGVFPCHKCKPPKSSKQLHAEMKQ